MRAVISATGDFHRHAEPDFHVPELMELAGVPMIQRVVELLTDVGVREFDFVLSHEPHLVRSFLGNGTRWGSKFRFHLSRNPAKPYRVLRSLHFADRESVVIALARCLPPCEAEELRTAFESASPAALCYRGGVKNFNSGKFLWTGWAAADAEWLASVDAGATQDEFAGYILSAARSTGSIVEVGTPIFINSSADLISAHWRAGVNRPAQHGTQSSNGVVKAKSASVHPTATLHPPVFIGEHSRIGRRVRIGPFASVGHNCIVADDTVVTDSVIHSGTWVGPGLHLTNIVTDGSRLTNTTAGVTTTQPDGLLISRLPVSLAPRLPHQLAACLIAALLSAVAIPLVVCCLAAGFLARLAALPGKKRPAWRQAFGATPYLGHFFSEIVPALPSLLLGRRNLIGVSEWASAELNEVPYPWRQLYDGSPVGLITECFVCFGPNPPMEERAAADAYYIVKKRASYNAMLAFRYARRVCSDITALPGLLARPQSRATVSL